MPKITTEKTILFTRFIIQKYNSTYVSEPRAWTKKTDRLAAKVRQYYDRIGRQHFNPSKWAATRIALVTPETPLYFANPFGFSSSDEARPRSRCWHNLPLLRKEFAVSDFSTHLEEEKRRLDEIPTRRNGEMRENTERKKGFEALKMEDEPSRISGPLYDEALFFDTSTITGGKERVEALSSVDDLIVPMTTLPQVQSLAKNLQTVSECLFVYTGDGTISDEDLDGLSETSLFNILSCILLDPQHGDNVLELCPLYTAQDRMTESIGTLLTIQEDILTVFSYEPAVIPYYRKSRLLDEGHITQCHLDTGKVILSHTMDKDYFVQQYKNLFNKILLRATCLDDRHSFSTLDSSNLFHQQSSKKKESILNAQNEELSTAFECLSVNGSLIFAVRTLSPPHAEDAVRRALSTLRHQDSSSLPAVDCLLPALQTLLPPHILATVQPSHLGVYFIPTLEFNHGPFYISKITKLPRS